MCPAVCRWPPPGCPGREKGFDRLCGEHLPGGDAIPVWKDSLLLC